MKIVGIILIVLGLGVFGYWGATGAHFVTQYQVSKEVKSVDDFGDEVVEKKLVPEFRFGLTPSEKLVDAALPAGGGPIGLGIVLILVDVFRSRKKESSESGGGEASA